VCLAIVLSGCGQSTIRPHAAEQTIADLVSKHTGFRPTDVRCPSGVPASVGGRFECRFTGPDGRYAAEVRIMSVRGQRVEEYIVTRKVGR
jgi:hypothetical protein